MPRSLFWTLFAAVVGAAAWFSVTHLGAGRRPGVGRDAIDRRASAPAGEEIASLHRARDPAAQRTTRAAGEDDPGFTSSPGASEKSPAAITGIVVDERGEPLARVPVEGSVDAWTGFEDWSRTPARGRVLATTETTEDGTFELRLGASTRVTLSALAPGRPEVRQSGCAEGDHVRLVVTSGAAVEGIVRTSAGGDPVPDARVRVNHGPWLRETAIVRTDALGRFRASGLEPGDGGVIVDPPRHTVSRWQDVALAAGETADVEVLVDEGWTLAGRVTAGESGDGIAAATVSAWRLIGKNARTDARGDFRIEGVRPSPGQLTVVAPGFGRGEIRYARAREDLDVRLELGCDVLGRVLDSEGEPIDGALAVAAGMTNEGKLSRQEWSKATASHDGRFQLRSLRMDVPLALQLRAPGFAARLVDLPLDECENGRLSLGDIRLSPQAILAGRVLASDGTPALGASMGVRRVPPIELPGESAFYFRGTRFEATDAGTFFIPGLAAGTWSVSAHLPGGPTTGIEVSVEEGERRDDLVLVFSNGTTLTGRVTDQDREGVARAFVMLVPEEEQPTAVLADQCNEFGEFEIGGVPGGRFTVRVNGPDPEVEEGELRYEPRTIRGFFADGTHLAVELARLDATARGRVVEASGGGVSKAYVCRAVDGLDLPRDGVLTDEDGRFELTIKGRGATEILAWRTADLAELGEDENLMAAEFDVQRKIFDEAGPAGQILVEGGEAAVELLLK